MRSRTFYEFFAGGGLVRLGLGTGWDCVGAVDSDARKVATYRANFGDLGLMHDDVRNVGPAGIPGVLDLAWASFPCRDLSVAGNRSGLDGGTSGAFWPCWQVIRRLVDLGRAPRVVALENVRNLIGSNGGADFAAVVGALVSAGYRVGALLIDASLFLPQSRKRIFIVGVGPDVALPEARVRDDPAVPWHPPDLRRAVAALPASLRDSWVWWELPLPATSLPRLADLVDALSAKTAWHSEAETADLVSTMAPGDLAKLETAKASGSPEVGTIYLRSRPGIAGARLSRANVRLDGRASCIVMPNGKMSSQVMLFVDGETVRSRYMTVAEGARLMGLPEGYRMPRGATAGFRILGDGVAVPVVRHLAHHLLEPLVDASRRPRTNNAADLMSARAGRRAARVPIEITDAKLKDRPGIKGATVGTTVYLIPAESKRLRRLALELDLSLHELLLRGADRLLAENGQRPIERYGAKVRVAPARRTGKTAP